MLNGQTITAIADVHLGNMRSYAKPGVGSLNTRALASLRVFEAALRAAGGRPLVVAGDLFDYANPEAMLLNRVRSALEREGSGYHAHFLMGNHDQHSTAPGDNALSAIGKGAVYDKPTHAGSVAMIPFRPNVCAKDYIESELWTMRRSAMSKLVPHTLVIHAGIADDSTPAFMLHKEDDFIQARDLFAIMETFDIRTVIAGNWHTPRAWAMRSPPTPVSNVVRKIIQCGALVPTGFDNPGLFYGLAVTVRVDSNGKMSAAPIGESQLGMTRGPRFVTLRHDEPIMLKVIEAHLDSVALGAVVGDRLMTGPTASPRPRLEHVTGPILRSKHTLSSFAKELYVQVKAPPGSDAAAIRADAESSILSALSVESYAHPTRNVRGSLEYLNVVPDTRAEERQHEEATQAARHNSTQFREAVEAYLDKMEVPEGVDRGVVLGRVLTYLGRNQ